MSYIRVTDASISSLNLSSVRTAGIGFSVLGGSVPPVIQGEDTIVVPVLFRPREFGEFSDTVTIESDGGNAKIPVRGKSPYPMLMTSIDTLIFGDVRKGVATRRSVDCHRNPVDQRPSGWIPVYTRTKWFTAKIKKSTVRSTDSPNCGGGLRS